MLRTAVLALAIGGLAMTSVSAAPQKAKPRPDLADIAAGTYEGNVMSDARGSSQSDVTITVTKVAPNTVEISSSYDRLPTARTRLTRAMSTIQNTGAAAPLSVFLLETGKSPMSLHVTVDDAAWAGTKVD